MYADGKKEVLIYPLLFMICNYSKRRVYSHIQIRLMIHGIVIMKNEILFLVSQSTMISKIKGHIFYPKILSPALQLFFCQPLFCINTQLLMKHISRFPNSGGYVWGHDGSGSKYTSVFQGSIFEIGKSWLQLMLFCNSA